MGEEAGIFSQGPRILFVAVCILHIGDTRLCQVNTQLFLLQCCLYACKYRRSYWYIWDVVPEHLQKWGRGSLLFSPNWVLNALQRISPSASLLNIWDTQFSSSYYSSRNTARQAKKLHKQRGRVIRNNSKRETRNQSKFYLLWKSTALQGTRYITLTLFTNIFHSRYQLLFKELALFCNFISFLQEILCCLFNWSSQNMSLFRTPSLFIRGALVAGVNQCCYLKTQMEGKKQNQKEQIRSSSICQQGHMYFYLQYCQLQRLNPNKCFHITMLLYSSDEHYKFS